jgi:hypothetical protein
LPFGVLEGIGGLVLGLEVEPDFFCLVRHGGAGVTIGADRSTGLEIAQTIDASDRKTAESIGARSMFVADVRTGELGFASPIVVRQLRGIYRRAGGAAPLARPSGLPAIFPKA